MIEVDARMSGETLIQLLHDPATDSCEVKLISEDGVRSLFPHDRAEAVEMFHHTFAYSQEVNNRDFAAVLEPYTHHR